jgi:hypothetical protein
LKRKRLLRVYLFEEKAVAARLRTLFGKKLVGALG